MWTREPSLGMVDGLGLRWQAWNSHFRLEPEVGHIAPLRYSRIKRAIIPATLLRNENYIFISKIFIPPQYQMYYISSYSLPIHFTHVAKRNFIQLKINKNWINYLHIQFTTIQKLFAILLLYFTYRMGDESYFFFFLLTNYVTYERWRPLKVYIITSYRGEYMCNTSTCTTNNQAPCD